MSDLVRLPVASENQGESTPPEIIAVPNPETPHTPDLEAVTCVPAEVAAAPGPAGAPASAVCEATAKKTRALAGPSGVERRRRRRALISAPIHVRRLNVTSARGGEVSTTIDVSRFGIQFETSQYAYYRGMEVAVVFPYVKSAGAIHAEQHGRVVRVRELPGGRSAVAIVLDAGARETLVDASGRKLAKQPVKAGPVHVRETQHEPQQEKPLIVAMDADDMVREALKAYLADEGYEVIAVNNGPDAREVLNMFTPALVIAEIEGEGMPGFELCAHIKETPRLRNIPVVLTTSSAYPSDYSNAHSLGAVVCIAKPYKQERLGHVVQLLAPTPAAKEQAAPARAGDPSRRHAPNGVKHGHNASNGSAGKRSRGSSGSAFSRLFS